MHKDSTSQSLLRGEPQPLVAADSEAFLAHLLRLDPDSLRDRFNGMVGKAFLCGYADRCFRNGVTVVGFVENGLVLAAGELHETGEAEAEAAFSVERAMRGRGIGGLLFDRVVEIAGTKDIVRIGVTTHADNLAMRGLARSRGLSLRFEGGEDHGWLELSRRLENRAA